LSLKGSFFFRVGAATTASREKKTGGKRGRRGKGGRALRAKGRERKKIHLICLQLGESASVYGEKREGGEGERDGGNKVCTIRCGGKKGRKKSDPKTGIILRRSPLCLSFSAEGGGFYWSYAGRRRRKKEGTKKKKRHRHEDRMGEKGVKRSILKIEILWEGVFSHDSYSSFFPSGKLC